MKKLQVAGHLSFLLKFVSKNSCFFFNVHRFFTLLLCFYKLTRLLNWIFALAQAMFRLFLHRKHLQFSIKTTPQKKFENNKKKKKERTNDHNTDSKVISAFTTISRCADLHFLVFLCNVEQRNERINLPWFNPMKIPFAFSVMSCVALLKSNTIHLTIHISYDNHKWRNRVK